LAGEHGHAFPGVDLQGRNQLAVDFIKNGRAGVWQSGVSRAWIDAQACYRQFLHDARE
jgi:hypothetical protein